LDAREQQLRRRQMGGLLAIAAGILTFTLWRAGVHAVFPQGWWHVW
jgi:hypothetical protein